MLNVKIGQLAPKFCLPDKTGTDICLDKFKGKWLVLYFYPKDNTQGCTLEAVDFTTHIDDFKKMGAEVIGISPDSVKSHQNFTEKHSLKINLLSDETNKVLEQYGVWQEKSMYGRTYFGVVRSTLLIDPTGKIVEIWEKVKVANHVENVKNRLKELK
ncbi:MAG: thioredoxin-dependent thiol peroxidase [Candidatus Thorarchaeota archaeon]